MAENLRTRRETKLLTMMSREGFPGGASGKEPDCHCRRRKTKQVLIPGSRRSPGGGHVSPLHYSCLENPMDRGAWWGTVHGVAKSQTQLKQFSTHAHEICREWDRGERASSTLLEFLSQ